ncbi:MAG: hypothetical protein RR847_00810 [Bacilli bacterium]
MKKDRNCGMAPYPVYPNYPGMPNQGQPNPNMMAPGFQGQMMPMNPNMMAPGSQGQMMPMNPNMMAPGSQGQMMPNIDIINNNQDDDGIATLTRQVNLLEKRVSRLESGFSDSNSFGNKYTDSNYHIL